MRHSKVINHLGRTSSHRKAMLANMATSLILHKRITTTTAKAKALRTFVEPLITKSKEDSTHSRRVVFSYLKDKSAVAELFREVSPKIAERPGGYTRILKIGNRIGDNADMCILELVDYNESRLGGEAAKAKTTRRRRAPKKKDEAVVETKAPKAAKAKAEKTKKPVAKDEETKGEAVPEE
ncbi:MAG: 50S ribosomal protein L17 [Bacteroidetes bacterium]|nr:MAG: 50S ribosomal protein L17 [Bacteroidota bacterium]